MAAAVLTVIYWKIEEELTKEGFELKGIDEELFIQDYEGFDGGFNCDSMHPKTLFTILQMVYLPHWGIQKPLFIF